MLALLLLSGCAVWSPWERTYSTASSAPGIFNDEIVSELVALLEEYFHDQGLVTHEKYRVTYPGNRWVIRLRIEGQGVTDARVCKDPSVCIHSISDQGVQVSYRIYCLENFFGRPLAGEPEDLLDGIKAKMARLVSGRAGKDVTFRLIEEKRYSSGKCPAR